ncbi:MAG: M56 family metallopeptidase [Pirellulaceae bacterium]|nr:M56 family metallopeptidase [Pirellulaceae bacterium]
MADWNLIHVMDLALCVGLLASLLSVVGLLGARWFRSSADRHCWLLTTLVVILVLPLAIVVLPRSLYPDFRLPVLNDLAFDWLSLESVRSVSPRELVGDAHGLVTLLLVAGCALWLLGVLPCLLRVACAWGQLKRVRLQGTPWRLPKQTSRYLKKKYGVKRLPQVILTGQVQNAITVGILHPQFMLNRSLVHELSDKQLRDVLDHEMAHVIRRDCLVMFLEQVARACHWCNPILQWLCNELSRCREQMCDNHVLDARPAVAYGETLLRVAELSLGERVCQRFVAMLSRWSDLRWRMQAILDPRQQRTALIGRWGRFVMVFSILFCGWLVGGVSFIANRAERQIDSRSQSDARLVETTR